MDKNRFISGMVMYTIKDDDLRKYVHDCIINEFGDNPLDESTYEIQCAAELHGETVKKLKAICENARKETRKDFIKGNPKGNNDFVTFYRATDSSSPYKYKIERFVIV